MQVEFQRLRFLVVEDDEPMRRILRAMLEGFGSRDVFEAADGAAGLEAFTAQHPDIVVIDWELPLLDGVEATRRMRDPDKSPNPFVPIIMVTGYAERRRVLAARNAGVNEFLVKPISAQALYERILTIVARPRPFLKTRTYFGPHPRRNADPVPAEGAPAAGDRDTVR